MNEIMKKENIDKRIIIVSKNIEGVLKSKYESQYSYVEFIKKLIS